MGVGAGGGGAGGEAARAAAGDAPLGPRATPGDARTAPGADGAHPEDLAPGTRIDEYEVISKIGRGGMGAVYRARHTLLGKDVALKVIAPERSGDPEFRARFFREAKVALEFVHRHAIPLRDFGVDESGRCYMTMDYSPGSPLGALLRREGPLPVPRACRILCQVLEALADAHRKRIVHRDLKPDNVLVEEDESGDDFVKVLDFGLAKMAGEDERASPEIGSGRVAVGTPAYMAPEQASDEPVDARADVYACGVILFQLVTGVLPFRGASPREVILQHLGKPAPLIAQVRPDLDPPPGFEAALRRALEKRPQDRYAHAEDMAEALAPFAAPRRRRPSGAATPGAPALPSPPPDAPTPPPSPRTISVDGVTADEDTRSPIPLPLDDPLATGATPRIAPLPLDAPPASALPSSLPPGSLLDRYRILERIADGGHGSVYKAEHVEMHRTCALKVMLPDISTDPEYVQRFRREAQAAARFKHPNAVMVYDFGNAGGRLFMAMELAPGEPLAARLRAEGALALRDAVEVVLQVLDCLDAAHRAGIVHRDLKPANIMLNVVGDWRNQVKVLDFGIAKVADAHGEAASFRSRAATFIGTPEYASPEQCRGDAEVDGRSDLYTAGVILFQLLSGALPFTADSLSGHVSAHISKAPRRLAEARPGVDIPLEVEEVIRRALEKTPAGRFASAREMAAALREASGLHPIFEAAERGVRVTYVVEETRRTASRNVKVLAAALAVAAAIAVAEAIRGCAG